MPTVAVETMKVNNGSALLEEKPKEASTEKSWLSRYRQLAHYFSLLCFLLIMVTLLLTLSLVQITFTFQSQLALQENKLKYLTHRLEELNQSYGLLFSQYPALNQYCSVSNSSTRVVQITFTFQSQLALQENKLKYLTHRLEELNQSYGLLFSQYPALNQYCSVSNSSTGETVCTPCPAGWTPNGEKCFLFSQDRADWISSQYRCMALGGAVATVQTEEEQVFLWGKAQSLSQGDSYWLGLRGGGGDGGWQWSDGSLVDKGPGFWEREPDNADSRELCGRLTPRDDYRKSWFTYSLGDQVNLLEQRVGANEDNVHECVARVKQLEKDNSFLMSKVDDLENRSRRSNLRFVGIQESAEGTPGARCLPYPADHREGTPLTDCQAKLPRAIMIELLNFQDKVKILRLAREKKSSDYNGKHISIYPDFSPELTRRRRSFDPVKRKLRELNMKYFLLYP
ncbi:hypothetical protein JOQ06_016264 [Pogonophryne albipinna]|uniref:C-type lectin domain-containing protein n=1 Tax=Pogonophryne albipinna TaxID=1090488 RepID=A0AAD6APH9_9TELE|nr:hypothetical protein JOQ06_016264 [Pogonophryne albipinna]